MKTIPAVKDCFPIHCRKHINEQMRQNPVTGHIFCRSCHKNRVARDKNSILRDLCGTSARAAREDMGL